MGEKELADRLGRTPRGIACWIRGERVPPLSLLPRIAAALTVPGDPTRQADHIRADLLCDVPSR